MADVSWQKANSHPWNTMMPDNHKRMSQKKIPLLSIMTFFNLWLYRTGKEADASQSFRFHLIRGRILLSIGEYEQAISDFRTALRLDWRHEQAAFWLNKAKRAIPQTVETGSLP